MSKVLNAGSLNYISPENSTTTNLSAGATFTGTGLDVRYYRSMSVAICSDVDSADNGLVLEFSTDGSTWSRYSNTYKIKGGQARFICVQIAAVYARAKYTNGSSTQSEMQMQTSFYENRESQDILYPSEESNFNSVLTMHKIFGTNKNISPVANSMGMPMVEIGRPTDSFGCIPVSTKSIRNTSSFLYNINSDIYDTSVVGSGTASSVDGMAELETGTTTGSSVLIDTKDFIRFTPGKGLMLSVSPVFGTPYADNEQWVGLGTDDNGFYIGYLGTTFCIWHRNNTTNSYINQSVWNEDKLDGEGMSGILMDPQKGNVFYIQAQWLFGNIRFFIENPSTTHMVLFHTLQYANSNVIPNLTEPAYKSRITVSNGPTTNNTKLKCSSATIFTSGEINYKIGILNCSSIVKTIERNQWKHMLSIRNKSNYLSKTNNIPIIISAISLSADNNSPTEVQLRKSVTLNATDPDSSDSDEEGVDWIDKDASNSVVEYTSHTETSSTGKLVTTFFVSKNSSMNQNMLDMELQINPGETYSLIAYTRSSNNEVYASITWRELF